MRKRGSGNTACAFNVTSAVHGRTRQIPLIDWHWSFHREDGPNDRQQTVVNTTANGRLTTREVKVPQKLGREMCTKRQNTKDTWHNVQSITSHVPSGRGEKRMSSSRQLTAKTRTPVRTCGASSSARRRRRCSSPLLRRAASRRRPATPSLVAAARRPSSCRRRRSGDLAWRRRPRRTPKTRRKRQRRPRRCPCCRRRRTPCRRRPRRCRSAFRVQFAPTIGDRGRCATHTKEGGKCLLVRQQNRVKTS